MCTFMTSNGPCKSILCSRWFDMLKWKQENKLITEKKKVKKKKALRNSHLSKQAICDPVCLL